MGKTGLLSKQWEKGEGKQVLRAFEEDSRARGKSLGCRARLKEKKAGQTRKKPHRPSGRTHDLDNNAESTEQSESRVGQEHKTYNEL